MSWSRQDIDARIRSIPDVVQLAIGLAFVVAVTAFKLTRGESVLLVDALIIPVVLVGWYTRRRRCGYVIAVVAAAASAFLSVQSETQASLTMAIASGAVRLVVYVVILAFLGVVRRERTDIRRAAAIDSRTGALNARAFHERAEITVELSKRYGSSISLAYIDLDDFKSINDRLGHQEGDRVLADVGHVLRTGVRAVDTVGRIGGDEFAVLMPETSAGEARTIIARIRKQLSRLRAIDGTSVVCSVGLASFASAPPSVDELISAADVLMYRAKGAGKGRVESADCLSPGNDVCDFDFRERSGEPARRSAESAETPPVAPPRRRPQRAQGAGDA